MQAKECYLRLLKHIILYWSVPINNYPNNVKHAHYDLCGMWAGLYYLKHFIRSKNCVCIYMYAICSVLKKSTVTIYVQLLT
jgi:hypothetical protein